MNKPYTIFLVSETEDVKYAELYALKFALEKNAAQCAMAWERHGVQAPAIEVGTSGATVPDGCFPLFFLDTGKDKGVLAQHYYDILRRGPAGRVFVDHCSGFNYGHASVAESASHEVVEMIVNPRLTEWRNSPLKEHDQYKVKVALESADPVQNTYTITHRGTQWKMANFIKPDWFSRVFNGEKKLILNEAVRGGVRFDHMGVLKHAGDILNEGYIVTSRLQPDGSWKRRNEGLHGTEVPNKPEKHLDHPLSRTNININRTVVG